jgi:hypothetical protein
MTAVKVQYARGWRKRKDVKTMSKLSDGGKGSSPRPYSVSQEEYAKRWDAIFQRDLDEPEIDEEETPEFGDEESLRCVRCGGVDTMYIVPNGLHMVCDQCGYAERVLPEVE